MLLYDSAVALLGIYPEKTLNSKDTCPSVHAAVFIIARHGRNLSMHLMDKEDVVVYIYTAIKNNEVIPFAAT